MYRDVLDGSDLLDEKGRLPSESIFPDKWADLSRAERREWKKKTLHWFNHALVNMREYYYNRPLVPWTYDCAEKCRRVQEKLSTN